jgi:hypothetical protein
VLTTTDPHLVAKSAAKAALFHRVSAGAISPSDPP